MQTSHKNRLLAAVLSAVLCGTVLSTLEHASGLALGDVDGDGSITIEDACQTLKAYATISVGQSTALQAAQMTAADTDGDGSITVKDALSILQYYAMQSVGLTPSWDTGTTPEDDPMRQMSVQALDCINQERINNGLSALTLSETIYKAASIRAEELIVSFSHTRPDGTPAYTALTACQASYTTAAENIAMGFSTPQSLVEAWMNSAGHRHNILNTRFQQAAIGIAQDASGYYYWSILFTD